MTSAQNRQKQKNNKKLFCGRIFFRQTLAAFICFFILKYLCSSNIISGFSEKLKNITEYNFPIENIGQLFNKTEVFKDFSENTLKNYFQNETFF